MFATRHTSFMALAISVLLLIGQAALANHVMTDALQGVDDNCELCHQFDRQQSVVPSSSGTAQLEPHAAPFHARNSAPLVGSLPSTAHARGPPLS